MPEFLFAEQAMNVSDVSIWASTPAPLGLSLPRPDSISVSSGDFSHQTSWTMDILFFFLSSTNEHKKS